MSDLTPEQLKALDEEVAKLDHGNDDHWTKAGEVNCVYLTATDAIDFTVKKALLAKRYPDMQRITEAPNESDVKSKLVGFKFKGRYPEVEGEDESTVSIMGITFEKGKFSPVEDEAIASKLRGNPHFEEFEK